MKKLVGSCILLSSLIMTGFSAHAQGQGVDLKNFYAGAGLGFNSIGPGARGFQIFAGYDFDFIINEDISTAVEIGYMDSGEFDGSNTDAKGIWVSALESVPLSSKTDMLVRLGIDFGDDDGLMLGTGLQYKFNTKFAFRMEYVARDNINSLQANAVVKF